MNKKSIINTISKEELQKIVYASNTLIEIVKVLGYKGTFTSKLKRRLDEDNIDYSHINVGGLWRKGKKFFSEKYKDINSILIENSPYNHSTLKDRILEYNLLEYKCSICYNAGEWLNKRLVLQLDHINGINNDNRIENLRFLCPNCHSQTPNYCKRLTKNSICINIENKTWRNNPKPATRICDRPSLEILHKNVADFGYKATGRLYGVSDNCIRKWIKSYMMENEWKELHYK